MYVIKSSIFLEDFLKIPANLRENPYNYFVMCFKRKTKETPQINSKFKLGDYVDFYYKDDVYFGHISNIYLDSNNVVNYDIDIAGQCPATLTEILESKVIRIHK